MTANWALPDVSFSRSLSELLWQDRWVLSIDPRGYEDPTRFSPKMNIPRPQDKGIWKGICHSSTGYQVLPYMITYTRALVLWSKARGDEGGEIRQDALDERWVVMAALGLEAKALWGKRKKRGTSPLWDQIRIPFSRLPISMLVSQSYLTLWTHGFVGVKAPLSRHSLGKNTGVGSHCLLQGIFPTQGLNLGLPHCRQIL